MRSTAKPLLLPEAQHDGRPQVEGAAGRAIAEQATAASLGAHIACGERPWRRGARTAPCPVRGDAPAIRRDGRARKETRWHDHDGAVALSDGLERKRHRHHRPAGDGQDRRPPGTRRRPPYPPREAYDTPP